MSHSKQRWTDKEVEKLVDMWIREVSLTDIGKALGREPVVVRAKVSALRRRTPKFKKSLKLRTIYPNYKLSAKQIPGIRKDKRSLRLIGLDYAVSPVTIYKIKTRATWKDA